MPICRYWCDELNREVEFYTEQFDDMPFADAFSPCAIIGHHGGWYMRNIIGPPYWWIQLRELSISASISEEAHIRISDEDSQEVLFGIVRANREVPPYARFQTGGVVDASAYRNISADIPSLDYSNIASIEGIDRGRKVRFAWAEDLPDATSSWIEPVLRTNWVDYATGADSNYDKELTELAISRLKEKDIDVDEWERILKS